mgnify:FL=1
MSELFLLGYVLSGVLNFGLMGGFLDHQYRKYPLIKADRIEKLFPWICLVLGYYGFIVNGINWMVNGVVLSLKFTIEKEFFLRKG